MPVLGSSSAAFASGNIKRGVVIPDGCLDRWADASTEAAAGLFEVSIVGDSTTYGAAVGGSPDPYYTWVRRLRELALAAGLPDGGYGIQVPADVAAGNFNADAQGYPNVGARTGWANTRYGAIYSFTSETPGDSIALSGVGTAFRLNTYRSNSNHGALSYSVDGGAAVPVSLTASLTGVGYVNVPVHVGGLSAGPHTVTIVNTSTTPTRAEFNIEWLNASGVVFHRDADSGTSSSTWADAFTAEAKSVSDMPVRLGLRGVTNAAASGGNTVNGYAWGAAPGPRPQYRNVGLTLVQIGTNDVNAASTTDGLDQKAEQYLENVALLVRTARAAGSDVLLISPPYTAAVHPQTQRQHGRMKSAMLDVALSHGCGYVDFQEALGWDVNAWPGRGYGNGNITNPHLSKAAYIAEAEYLWDKVLAPTLA